MSVVIANNEAHISRLYIEESEKGGEPLGEIHIRKWVVLIMMRA